MAVLGCLDRFDNTIAGWAFDSEMPGQSLEITVEVEGSEIYRSDAKLYRGDLLEAIGECDHGFSFDLLVVRPEANELVLDVFAHGSEKILLGGGFWKSTDVAVEGKDGWLFLNTDSNDVNAVISGTKPVDDAQLSECALLFATRAGMLHKLGIPYQSIIMPEKNVVNARYRYNSSVSVNRPAILIRDLAKKYNCDLIYPINEFQQGGPFFHKTDTHVNAAGYALIFSCLQQSKLLPFGSTLLPEPSHNDSFCGDLGNKFSPHKSEQTIEYVFPTHLDSFELIDPIPEILENGSSLRGASVRTYYSDAPYGKALLFGTSSAYGFLPLLCHVFKEVFFIWENTFDYRVIQDFNPDLVLHIVSERFLPISCNDLLGIHAFDI